ncbi:Protein ALP1-like [Cardamine amara subsp. amara]|uniref:Protein ALP1-like n=1 Tax=Cardamine amara subsp. amara TaxID=228776 RepID=A0ABD1C8U4_CARAN
MTPAVFLFLCSVIREQTSLRDTKYISVEEMVATFLLIVGQNSRYCYTKDTFKRSMFTTSNNFHRVLRALNQIAPSLMVKPELVVPDKIRESTRFYPYFKNCVGAIDGTHIFAMVANKDAAAFRNRKGDISQNVLAACNFDLEFIYVLSGWEGSAHDSRILNDALTRNTNRLPVPEGKFYVVDCGFANRPNFLAPYRGVRYHLQEFSGQNSQPTDEKELFNHRHASLRNVVERIFGIFKSRFLIFKSAPPFPYETQAEIVLACAGLHNFLRKNCRSDIFPEESVEEVIEDTNDNDDEFLTTQEQQREYANQWRATIATDMWTDSISHESHG